MPDIEWTGPFVSRNVVGVLWWVREADVGGIAERDRVSPGVHGAGLETITESLPHRVLPRVISRTFRRVVVVVFRIAGVGTQSGDRINQIDPANDVRMNCVIADISGFDRPSGADLASNAECPLDRIRLREVLADYSSGDRAASFDQRQNFRVRGWIL